MARKGTGKRKRPSNRPPSQSGWSRSNLATPLTSKATLSFRTAEDAARHYAGGRSLA
jgi:hypothetical protein